VISLDICEKNCAAKTLGEGRAFGRVSIKKLVHGEKKKQNKDLNTPTSDVATKSPR